MSFLSKLFAALFGRPGTPAPQAPHAPTPHSSPATAPVTLAPWTITTNPTALSGLTAAGEPGDHGQFRVTVTVQPGEPLPRFRYRVGHTFPHWSGVEGFEMTQGHTPYGLPSGYLMERYVGGQWVPFAQG